MIHFSCIIGNKNILMLMLKVVGIVQNCYYMHFSQTYELNLVSCSKYYINSVCFDRNKITKTVYSFIRTDKFGFYIFGVCMESSDKYLNKKNGKVLPDGRESKQINKSQYISSRIWKKKQSILMGHKT